jgi:hypothetical protein
VIEIDYPSGFVSQTSQVVRRAPERCISARLLKSGEFHIRFDGIYLEDKKVKMIWNCTLDEISDSYHFLKRDGRVLELTSHDNFDEAEWITHVFIVEYEAMSNSRKILKLKVNENDSFVKRIVGIGVYPTDEINGIIIHRL